MPRSNTSRSNSSSENTRTTTDHREIREWALARDARPSCVTGTGRNDNDPGILRMDLPGYAGEDSLQEISWDDFFEAFEANDLAFIYQEETASGEPSNFNKFVKRSSD